MVQGVWRSAMRYRRIYFRQKAHQFNLSRLTCAATVGTFNVYDFFTSQRDRRCLRVIFVVVNLMGECLMSWFFAHAS